MEATKLSVSKLGQQASEDEWESYGDQLEPRQQDIDCVRLCGIHHKCVDVFEDVGSMLWEADENVRFQEEAERGLNRVPVEGQEEVQHIQVN